MHETCTEQEYASQNGKRFHLRFQEEAQPEQRVEEHLEIERPADIEHGVGVAVGAEVRQEQHVFGDVDCAETFHVAWIEAEPEQTGGKQCEYPVGRHNARDAVSPEFGCGAFAVPGCVEHYEAGDDEEDVYPCPSDITQMRHAQIKAHLGLQMVPYDREGGERPQHLNVADHFLAKRPGACAGLPLNRRNSPRPVLPHAALRPAHIARPAHPLPALATSRGLTLAQASWPHWPRLMKELLYVREPPLMLCSRQPWRRASDTNI